MPYYAWHSRTSERRDGTATWTRPDGKEIEVSFVAEGPDELSVEPGIEFNDLVFLGEVVKCVRLATELDYNPDDFDPGDFA